MPIESFDKLPAEKKEKILVAGIREFAQKSYKDVSTDVITKECGISKGLLFHYFGSKKEYYLYCLRQSLECLTEDREEVTGDDFYAVVFSQMERKMRICTEHRDGMHMVNMASRDASKEIAAAKAELIAGYMKSVHAQSQRTLLKALGTLELRYPGNIQKTAEALQIYTNAVINRYLARYQDEPDRFFENSMQIRKEMKEYLDIMLEGICRKETK
ncbi:MAG: TetR/AcrR family transcriptional regulator [Solobacterium sp.]|nr:TetR/AcrR family transcriptional regulator [Solobacterium sp.]